jgi:hypothetical protein
MPDHTVEQGECLSSIADKFGIPKAKIWNHSRNSDLRQNRLNPDTLFPGDVIFVPPITLQEIACATDQRHVFVKKLNYVRFRLRLLLNDAPRANESYTLLIGGLTLTGYTDPDGWLDEQIPASEPTGTLILKNGEEQHTLGMGTIDPIEEITGIQGRLQNLAYLDDNITGVWDEATADAVGVLQRKNNLPPTGKMDADTVSQLKKEYGH